ncbi:MAG: hypothetical protein EOO23_04515 [Comamonadaceae bacterium]|nr:MAG: hypothetical protein EOO23_04515 [Comamonadaceae bacterium]
MNELAFEEFRLEVRKYRDKFVAHLDELNQAEIPRLQPAIDSVRYLYDYLVQVEDDLDAFPQAPQSARAYYAQNLALGREGHQA